MSTYASTSVIESTSSILPLSTLSDLDDPGSGYLALANELRKLPKFQQKTPESNIAVQRIATLALQSNDRIESTQTTYRPTPGEISTICRFAAKNSETE
jgi:hypothetical protein